MFFWGTEEHQIHGNGNQKGERERCGSEFLVFVVVVVVAARKSAAGAGRRVQQTKQEGEDKRKKNAASSLGTSLVALVMCLEFCF